MSAPSTKKSVTEESHKSSFRKMLDTMENGVNHFGRVVGEPIDAIFNNKKTHHKKDTKAGAPVAPAARASVAPASAPVELTSAPQPEATVTCKM